MRRIRSIAKNPKVFKGHKFGDPQNQIDLDVSTEVEHSSQDNQDIGCQQESAHHEIAIKNEGDHTDENNQEIIVDEDGRGHEGVDTSGVALDKGIFIGITSNSKCSLNTICDHD